MALLWKSNYWNPESSGITLDIPIIKESEEITY